MKLVVGLGNPGRKYFGTRHNVGFEILGVLAAKCGLGKAKAAFQGETVEANLAGERALLLCPQTYMNLSGGSVLAARDFYKLPHEDILIVCDDFNLPLAKLRFRAQGSAGGQKGLADIIRRLGTESIPRLRFGVGDLPPGRDPAGFVLGKFTKEEIAQAEPAVTRAADAVVEWARSGIQHCMNQYN